MGSSLSIDEHLEIHLNKRKYLDMKHFLLYCFDDDYTERDEMVNCFLEYYKKYLLTQSQ
jgi:hypothetical protein